MTESEWNGCTDPTQMLEMFLSEACFRQMRLVAVACSRRILHLLNGQDQILLNLAEEYADGLIKAEELEQAVASIPADSPIVGTGYSNDHIDEGAIWTVQNIAQAVAEQAGPWRSASNEKAWAAEETEQAKVIRDIFAPFVDHTRERLYLSPTVLSLAQGIYDDRAFDLLPVLADALEEAGCTDASILDHCRGPGPHVRGCWVVDLVLGKE